MLTNCAQWYTEAKAQVALRCVPTGHSRMENTKEVENEVEN